MQGPQVVRDQQKFGNRWSSSLHVSSKRMLRFRVPKFTVAILL